MLLLITGCILVDKNTPYVTIRSKTERLEAYKETIRWALEKTFFDKVVFCDNSNYDLDNSEFEDLAKSLHKNYEYLTFEGNKEALNQKGKGFGEGEIVEYALQNSSLLSKETAFCKITGRLKISNINKLIKSTKKNYFMNMRLERQVDTRFYCVQKEVFLKYLKMSYKNVDDYKTYYLEHAYYDSLNKINKVKYRSFYERPLFVGISGSTGKIYADKNGKRESLIKILCHTNLFNKRIIWRLEEVLLNNRKKNKK